MKKILLLLCFFYCLSNGQGQHVKGRVLNDSATAIWKEIAPFFKPTAELKGELGAYRSPLHFYDGRPVTTAKDWQKRRDEILTRWNMLMGK